MHNVAPETGRHHNIRQRLPAEFFWPAADLRAALAAQRQAKHEAKLARAAFAARRDEGREAKIEAARARAALAAQRQAKLGATRARAFQIEADVRHHRLRGTSNGRIAEVAGCSLRTVSNVAKRLGLTRGGS